jgi:hypothetical protein
MPISNTPTEEETRPTSVALLLTPEQVTELKVAVARNRSTMQKLVTSIVLEKLPELSKIDLT